MLISLVDRLKPLASELTKFVVVGGFCFLLDFILFNVLHFVVGLGPMTSKTLSTVTATGVSYLGNRLWSFSHRVDDNRGHRQDLTIYAVINVIGLLVTLIPLGVVFYFFTRDPIAVNIAQTFGTAVATVFRFWSYRKYVFINHPDLAEKTALV